ncbi:MAG: hypothetical protein MUF00_13775 [Gemmatimonadaceae bacterium]|nr:hypothetical protein [Gemmatimonadaceae bacterium]
MRAQHRGLALPLRLENLRPLARLGVGHRRTPFALGAHLQLHRLLDIARRFDGLQLHTRHIHAPRNRGLLDHLAHAPVDHVARGQCLIELDLANDVAQRRARERLEGKRQILHRVSGLLRIGDAVVEHRVDVDRHVVLRDHRLAREVEHLFAQVDPGGRGLDHLLVPVAVGLEVADVNRLGALHERDEDVEPGACDPVEAAQPLDDQDLRLRNDADRLREQQDDDSDGDERGDHGEVR